MVILIGMEGAMVDGWYDREIRSEGRSVHVFKILFNTLPMHETNQSTLITLSALLMMGSKHKSTNWYCSSRIT